MSEPSTDEPRGIDRSKVDPWLLANVAGSVAPFRYQLIAAGGSNLTFRVTDDDGKVWALRRPPVGHALPTAHDMHREWRIMAALADTPVPVPACIAYCADVEVRRTNHGLGCRCVMSSAAATPSVGTSFSVR